MAVRCFAVGIILASVLLGTAIVAEAADLLLYVGTYTRGTDSEGIYVLRFDDATGAMEKLSVATGVENPSFLALHPSGRLLYCCDEVETYQGQPSGAVSGFAIDADSGALTLLNRQATGGASPCHVCVDKSGRRVLAAAYSGGSVAELPIAMDASAGPAGMLGPPVTLLQHSGSSVDPARQTSPHPHQVVLSPEDRFALVPDLGLDQIVIYRFSPPEKGLRPSDARPAKSAPGAGPRHLAFHPNGRCAYVINELDLTIDQFDYDAAAGVLTNRRTTATMPEGADRAGVSGAEIAVHPDGRTLYASLRGRDEIVVFRLDAATGAPTLVQRISTGGQTPRNFALDPSGKWLLAANQTSGSIVAFQIGDDGQLQPAGETIDVPSPVCLVFLAP